MQAAQLSNTPLTQAAQFGGPQDVNAQNVGTQDYTGGNVSKYMNPYLQSALDPQLAEVQRQYDITGTQQKSGAAKSGAFGGSREALMAAENQRNAGIAKNQILSQGYNQAFNNAQQQFNAQQQASLQAQQANQGANLQAGISNQNMGYNTGLQNAQLQQQANLANQGLMGQYGLQQGQFGQAANAANQQAQMQANLANQGLAGQYGLQQGQFGQAANQANQQTQQQTNLANQALAGQYGMQQGQFGQAANQFNAGNQQQANLANQALAGQYGMQQGQFNQAANQANQASRNQFGMANLANQQTANQANQAAQNQFGMANLANQQQSGLANQALMGQYGMQQGQFNQAANLANQQSRNQANLANQQAQLAAQGQNIGQQQFGANYRMQGLGQAGQLSGQLAGIGGQQLQAQQGILTAQNAVGAQQQQLQQQQINQAIQDYANAQQYPIMQLGTMSNMLRGLPMQAQTTQQYQAQANPITQGIGALGAGASLYNAVKAKGGVVKAAEGGIMSYDVGGSIRAKLEDMPDESLKAQLKSSSSESIKNDIKEILATRNMAGIKQAASGGILRYAEPNEENNQGVTTSRDVKYPNESIARDAQMYKNLGAYLGPGGPILDAPNRVWNMLRDNVVTPAVQGVRNFVNEDPAIQKIKYGYGEENKKDFFVTPEQQARDAKNIQAVRDNRVEQIVNPDGKTVDPKSILAANPAAAPAGTSPKVTTPAGAAPASVASSDGTGKIPPDRLKAIVDKNPQLKDAMGNKPGPTASVTEDIMKMISKNLGVDLKPPVDENAGMTTAEILARDEKAAKEFAGENPAMARRKQIMAEKTSAADDAKYTQAMRMAEFFAMWGSTPGNTIVAGLNAMKAKIPDFISDKKEATKIRRDMDKSIADLDQIDYLEKVGKIDAADKKRTASIKFGIDTWGTQIAKAASLTATTVKEITDREIAANKEIGDTERNRLRVEGGKEEARIRSSGANSDIKNLSSIQGKITGLLDAERKLRDGPLKADLKFIEHKAAILKQDPKRAEDIAEREKRVKEQLEPIIAQRRQLEQVAAGMAPIQNLPGQASGSASDTVIRYNAKGEVIK
jgi:hypothetical protein